MRYEWMFPDQIRKAIDERWPVVLPVGVLEYHAEHCCVGVDTVLVLRAFEELEKEMDLVILPTFYYGSSSYVVSKPERAGSIHVKSDTVKAFAGELFRNLLRIGFRNVHCFIHHQSENFMAGMPTDLAFRLAARQEIFAFLEANRGEDWWGDNSMKDYYNSLDAAGNPFNWIQVHPFMSAESKAQFPIDHAAKQETSLMMAFCPEGVDMGRYVSGRWYTETAREAGREYGEAAKALIMKGLRATLAG